MGYHTEFNGEFNLDKPLTIAHANYLRKFSETRRMKRNPVVLMGFPDEVREKVGLGLGIDGEFFVGGMGFAGQDHDESVVDHNTPPKGQPGLWCQWVPTDDGEAIVWDGGEKFYDYVLWIKYIIRNFIQPWGYTLNGEVEWAGEDREDMGKIIITNNEVKTKRARVTWAND